MKQGVKSSKPHFLVDTHLCVAVFNKPYDICFLVTKHESPFKYLCGEYIYPSRRIIILNVDIYSRSSHYFVNFETKISRDLNGASRRRNNILGDSWRMWRVLVLLYFLSYFIPSAGTAPQKIRPCLRSTENTIKTAVFWDTDNICNPKSLKSISNIISEYDPSLIYIASFGNGDGLKSKEWRALISNYNINNRCYRPPKGCKTKNAADIEIIIDVMEKILVYGVNEVIVLSSDSDFAPLAHRLSRMGVRYIGVGTEETRSFYQMQCYKFYTI